MGLSQYYNRDRNMLNKWMQAKQDAHKSWGKLATDIGTMGMQHASTKKADNLSQGYTDYTAGLGEGEEAMSREEWDILHGDDYLKGLKQDRKQNRRP